MSNKFLRLSPQRTTSSGFTLIELLVVIAIIAILAAILFPVFARARENARRSSCQSNLKQWGLVFMQYSQDYDEWQPLTWSDWTAAANTSAKPWMLNVQPYVKNVNIFQCPSANGIVTGTVSALRPWRTELGLRALPVSYAYNCYIGGQNPESTDPLYKAGAQYGVKKLSQIAKPAGTIMMTDSGTVPPFGDGEDQGGTDNGKTATTPPSEWNYTMNVEGIAGNNSTTDPSYASRTYTSWIAVHAGSIHFSKSLPNYGTPAARHLGTTNILFTDGHVKAMRMEQIMEISPNASYSTKNTTCWHPNIGCPGS